MPTLQEIVTAAVHRYGAAGAVAGRLHRGEREYAAAGVARVDTGAPMSADIPVRIASVTKPIVTTAVLRALRDDPAALRAPVLDLLPELRPQWRAHPGLCLLDLLSHTCGLRPDLDLAAALELGDGPDAQLAACAAIVSAGQVRRPRAAWSYTNSGFWLAGAVLAARAGVAFERAVADALLAPAGMAETGFDPPTRTPAAGHRGGATVRAAYPRARRASGGAWSTVPDLLTFAEFVLAHWGDGLRSAAVARTPTLRGTLYGLGWETTGGERPVVWHDGDWGGFRARLLVAPAARFAVVTVVNDDVGGVIRQAVPRAAAAGAGLTLPGPGERVGLMITAYARLGAARLTRTWPPRPV